MMHPFRWVPGDGERHATLRRAGCRCAGAEIETLCGRQVIGEDSVLAWLWQTCPICNAEAHRLVAETEEAAR